MTADLQDAPVSPQAIALAFLPHREADDVDFVPDGRNLCVVFSAATLARERVFATRWTGKIFGVPVPLVEDASVPVFRPAVAALADGALILGAAKTSDGFRPVGMFWPQQGQPARFVLDAARSVLHIALAAQPGRDRAWLAWEERRGQTGSLKLGRLDGKGRCELLDLACIADERGVSRRWPALALSEHGKWLAWLQADAHGPARVMLARIDADEPTVVAIDPYVAHQDAVALALLPDGNPVLAWHSRGVGDALPAAQDGPLDQGVLPWIRAAVYDRATSRVIVHAPHVLGPSAQSAAGIDQGWEFPSLAGDDEGGMWLAGRSSHGFHVAHFRPAEGFGPQLALSNDAWGGRGRRHALRCVPGRGVVFARREPDGLSLSALSLVREGMAEGTAGAPARGPAEPRRDASVNEVLALLPLPLTAGLWSPANVAPGLGRGRRILFGDLHQHTALSDGLGTPEELYRIARDTRALDFAAVTDHDSLARRAIGPASWAYLCEVANEFYEPGRFATLCAYEFSGARHPGPGHKCVYFGDSVPDALPEKRVDAVFAAVAEHHGFAVPHHVGWTGADLLHHDPMLQPVWEICSVQGCYECEQCLTSFPARTDPLLPGHFVRDALEAGHRFGFVGSSDSHGLLWHHGISRKENPFETGLAALVGTDANRPSILQAVRARRTYATTGARIQLHVELDGAAMGRELAADTRGELAVFVHGTAAIRRVIAVRRTGETVLEFRAQAPTRVEARASIAPDPARPWDYVYVRVEQEDGEMAWASPLWLG